MRKFHRYTDEQIEYIRKNCKGKTRTEIKIEFNKRFGLNVTEKSISAIMYRNGIKTNMQGYNTRFKKGNKSWNKGKKGLQLGGEKGWFKKGYLPPSHKPVGSESLHQGYIWIKIKEPNVWQKKHQYLWIQAHGEIPKGMVLLFKDGDRLNCTLDNLFLVPRRAMSALAKQELDFADPEYNVIAHKIAELNLITRDKEQLLEEGQ